MITVQWGSLFPDRHRIFLQSQVHGVKYSPCQRKNTIKCCHFNKIILLWKVSLYFEPFPYSCTFKSAELIHTKLKHCQKTATVGGDMLLSKRLKGVSSGGELTANSDQIGAQALLGADLVGVSS